MFGFHAHLNKLQRRGFRRLTILFLAFSKTQIKEEIALRKSVIILYGFFPRAEATRRDGGGEGKSGPISPLFLSLLHRRRFLRTLA